MMEDALSFYRDGYFSLFVIFLGKQAWRSLGIVVGVLTRNFLLRGGGGRIFSIFQCSIISCFFITNIFVGVKMRFPVVL